MIRTDSKNKSHSFCLWSGLWHHILAYVINYVSWKSGASMFKGGSTKDRDSKFMQQFGTQLPVCFGWSLGRLQPKPPPIRKLHVWRSQTPFKIRIRGI